MLPELRLVTKNEAAPSGWPIKDKKSPYHTQRLAAKMLSRIGGHAMPHYRAYVLDEHGHLLGALRIDCIDDETAKEQAERLLDGHDGELWQLVAVFSSNDPPCGLNDD
jgi:hypothetical protein